MTTLSTPSELKEMETGDRSRAPKRSAIEAGELVERVVDPKAPRRQIAGQLLLVPLLVLLMIHALHFINVNSPNRLSDWLFWGKWQVLENATEPVDWLILGDSSAAYGVEREAFLNGTGGTALNLATVADSLTVNDAWMLQRYVERFGPPKRGVLIIRSLRSWPKDPSDPVITSVPLGYGFWNRLEPKVEFDQSRIIQYILNRWLPVYNNPKAFRKMLRPYNRSLDESAELLEGGFIRYSDHRPEMVARSLRSQLRFLRQQKVIGFSSANRAGVRQLVRLAEQHDMDLFWANPPVSEPLWERPVFRRNFTRVSKQLTRLFKQSDRIHSIMANPMIFPASEMQNADHLIHSAAKRYTEALVEELNRNL